MKVVLKSTSKLCSSKFIVTINGKFPGPTLHAREDDIVLVIVVNRAISLEPCKAMHLRVNFVNKTR